MQKFLLGHKWRHYPAFNCRDLPKNQRHDIQHNDTQHDDIQLYGLHCDTQHNATAHKH